MSFHRLLLLLTALPPLLAQDHGSITGNPFSTPQDRLAGGRAFRAACAACHGLDGAGGSNGPSLTTGSFKHGGSDEALFRTITKGIPDTPMAAFPIDGGEVWQLIAFIRYLNVGRGAQAKGNPAQGAILFASLGCARCHTAEGAGGFTAPDLNGIGSRRSLSRTGASWSWAEAFGAAELRAATSRCSSRRAARSPRPPRSSTPRSRRTSS